MNSYLESLNWRYATKKFDTDKKISERDLNLLVEATRLSASSFGLQPYHVFVVTDPEIRTQLKEVSWGQSQITDASHLFVFANKKTFGPELIDSYLSEVSNVREIPQEGLKAYGDFMKSKLIPLPEEVKESWAAKQTYLAVGNLLSAAGVMEIDSCPMEGFEVEAYDRILKLDEKDLTTSVVVALGYRSEEDETQHFKKVRRPKESLFTHI
ncbi:NAD(P)H-dependent oxidoreductase [Muriicola marianensis]|uniref:NAD(P)H-dependent oxidoreductase n=1 Tax=Muriicola marianensis TaxID=1324801 RepID=A0ABQ1QUB5_9FLAO|nr:NAD(P)H-dependent oxidoreductase [Muriicola marianensis]GGD44136.1 NAD(P)H-dependent oxidoreductase [Muriicola marianensis]